MKAQTEFAEPSLCKSYLPHICHGYQQREAARGLPVENMVDAVSSRILVITPFALLSDAS
eukprot:1264531-Amphidinium_carterae.2